MDTPLAELKRPADPMVPGVAVIRRRRRETHDIYSLEIQPPQGSDTFPFVPGQFNMLYVLGQGDVAISISGDPGRTDTIVHTIRAVGPITKALTGLRQGDEIGIRGPYGSGWPIEVFQGSDVVIVAGGVRACSSSASTVLSLVSPIRLRHDLDPLRNPDASRSPVCSPARAMARAL